jgi:hypothetical protein
VKKIHEKVDMDKNKKERKIGSKDRWLIKRTINTQFGIVKTES